MYFTKLKDYLLSNIQFNILLNSLADLRETLELAGCSDYQGEEDDKQTILKIINTMLTKKKFKDFFNKNIATL